MVFIRCCLRSILHAKYMVIHCSQRSVGGDYMAHHSDSHCSLAIIKSGIAVQPLCRS